jgi:thymidylate synthase
MNNLDKQYTNLLQDILDNGTQKSDRTGTGTLSVFGRQIRHKMSDGFPLLTTKKMPFRTIATELMWFLRGDTNIKYLVDNDVHIWDGDAYKNYTNSSELRADLSKEEFIHNIKMYPEFAKKWGELGPVYGKQWRGWEYKQSWENGFGVHLKETQIDQITNLIGDLKTNPDSRRLMVNAWNVGELDQMTLPPCHYGFQVYTRELSLRERSFIAGSNHDEVSQNIRAYVGFDEDHTLHKHLDENNIPRRAISLMWNQRSVDTFLGLPFNIASYGLLLEIIAKAVNMVPDELIGNLGDTHLYLNHVEQAKEQIGRKLDLEERRAMVTQEMFNQIYNAGDSSTLTHSEIDQWDVPRIKTREPYPLPTLNINTEFWPTESGECGVGPIDAVAVFAGFVNDHFCKCLLEEDLQLGNYQAHPTIKAPLSN